jgi:malonate decarboxylase epsilon subunit
VVSIAFLFPGQGAQSPGFLHRLPPHPATLEEASQLLGFDITTLDTAATLQSTVAVQLTTFVASIATARALHDVGVVPDAAAGLSVGAFGAAVTCGALTFADALALVRLRGQCMARAYPTGYGMAAIVGLDERQIATLIGSQLYLANVNAPTQMVLSGPTDALDAAIAAARQLGAHKAERLAVSVPSHSPLLDDVAHHLADAMASITITPPRIPYISNRRARAVHDAASVREDLIHNVANTVRWHDAVTVLHELGARLFIELSPGDVLSRLAQAAFPDARAIAVDDARLDSITLLANREHARTT